MTEGEAGSGDPLLEERMRRLSLAMRGVIERGPWEASMEEAQAGALPPDGSDWGTAAMDVLIAGFLDLFGRNSESRVVMEAARRSGVPYSVARVQWRTAEDIAAEIAYDAYTALDRAERCHECGTRNDEMRDPETKRVLSEPKWKVVGRSCIVCGIMSAKRSELTQEERESGFRYTAEPRRPLDPLTEN